MMTDGDDETLVRFAIDILSRVIAQSNLHVPIVDNVKLLERLRAATGDLPEPQRAALDGWFTRCNIAIAINKKLSSQMNTRSSFDRWYTDMSAHGELGLWLVAKARKGFRTAGVDAATLECETGLKLEKLRQVVKVLTRRHLIEASFDGTGFVFRRLPGNRS